MNDLYYFLGIAKGSRTTLLAVALLLPALVKADDAGTAFATGFAQAVNHRLGGQDYVPPPQAPAPVVVQPVYSTRVITAFNNNGTEMGEFGTFSACRQFLRGQRGGDCLLTSK